MISNKSIAGKTCAWAELQKIPVWFQATATSTNTVAKNESVSDQMISLYLTENQTAGRGRNQNTWLQSADAGQLFSSWVFNLHLPPQPILAPLVGLALYKALDKTWGSLFSLKAPNDIYLGDKKLAGILIENIQSGPGRHRLIIGIGLNVFSKPDLPTAICLADSIEASVIESRWSEFLMELFSNLKQCALNSTSSLSLNDRQAILAALNRFPHLSDAFLEVQADGSLKSESRFINWSDL